MAETKPENRECNLQNSTIRQRFLWWHFVREATFFQRGLLQTKPRFRNVAVPMYDLYWKQ